MPSRVLGSRNVKLNKTRSGGFLLRRSKKKKRSKPCDEQLREEPTIKLGDRHHAFHGVNKAG